MNRALLKSVTELGESIVVEKEFGLLDSVSAPFFNRQGVRDGRLSVTVGRQLSEIVATDGWTLTPNAQLV